ncbi:sarcosine oxidase subunit gamma [Pseudotabrizicola formosa]|uniref:sarcosine oxidase subunit gamma n=1 Tax=Pseudotabrizicola formosa TaxID=2030009 RepID=UPI00143D42C1|nr:sarcosine oxidase subunit gamma [Pseudotabrizicola formosa]
MPDLIAKPALGLPPLTHAGTTLAEAALPQITAIAPFPGQSAAVGTALGLTFPAPNCVTEAGEARLVWAGRDLAFLLGKAAPEGLPAAVTDQSDGWVALTLSGPQAVQVLARLVPLDLRDMPRGQAARTALNHLPLVLIAEGEGAFTLLTFRSMARTAWHEIGEAMEKLAARAALTP